MLQNYKKLRKVIYLDIVPNLFIGTEYLRSLYGAAVHDYLITRNNNRLFFKENDDLEIYCIAPWQIEALDLKIDYFHNAHSFVEIPEKAVKNYAFYIEKFLKPYSKIALVSYDGFSEETTFHPRKLSGFFNRKLDMTSHPSLIKRESKNYYFIG